MKTLRVLLLILLLIVLAVFFIHSQMQDKQAQANVDRILEAQRQCTGSADFKACVDEWLTEN